MNGLDALGAMGIYTRQSPLTLGMLEELALAIAANPTVSIADTIRMFVVADTIRMFVASKVRDA